MQPARFSAWTLGICLLLHTAWAQSSDRPALLVLHNSFVSAEKFQQLRGFAAEAGLALDHLNVEGASAEALQAGIDASDMVLLDVPRPNDRASVSEQVAARIQHLPQLTVGGGRPAWEKLPPQYAQVLGTLYAGGGEANFRRFFDLAVRVLQGSSIPDTLLTAPENVPATGFYHPLASEIFTTLDDYLAWQASRLADRTGHVAYLIHSGVVRDMLTRDIDELIERTEAAGMLPMVFWFDATAEAGLPAVFGNSQVDVLVNLTHMQNGSARSEDFLALDIPVIQTLRFRDGEASDWPGATSGIPAGTTAVFLAGPEGWGISDPLVLSASTAGVDDLLPAQADALIAKLQRLVALRHTPAPEKKLALMFWNYPAGEKNLGASHLNVPRSIVSIQQALLAEGYALGEPVSEAQVIATAQRMLASVYGSVTFDDLLAEGLAALYPLADYQHWLASLPQNRQDELLATGSPLQHRAVRRIDGEDYFVIPRWDLGHLLIMPQMPRQAEPHSHYHDTARAPDHLYMASYLYLQQTGTNALIHLGTHGSQEWLPGKDRGLAADDYPWLAAGSLPVFYPYIQDNVGEAIQAKRRGRAATISHQTPPFAPAGLYDQLRDLHHLIHEYEQLDTGMVRDQVSEQIRNAAIEANLHADLGWTAEQAAADFDGFLLALHDQLHELSRTAMPLGLHTFGQPAPAEHRISTILQQLGQPFYAALEVDEEEIFAADQHELSSSPAYQAVQRLLDPDADQTLLTQLQDYRDRARELDQRLQDTQENEALLAGLAGRFVAPGSGGDPIRNPEVLSGRNLYAFEADKIPARAAYDSAARAYEQLLEAFRAEHDGQWPEKLAFSLWSSEAIRHLGVTEAQVLHALGLRPVWDAGGRVTELQIIPAAELGRPRADVVVQVTSVYRDQFDSFMRLLGDALQRLAELEEPGNPLIDNNRRIAGLLEQGGMSNEEAEAAARYRIFSNAPGEYGTGVPDLALRSTEWDDDAELAQQFLASSRFAYGGQSWGDSPAQSNLLAEQLRGTQAAIMSRSSNLHGVLSTDHPFEFLGGLSAAIRHLDGAAPQLLISDLRNSEVTTTGLARFLADELRARYLNPQWINAMQGEGYAGTLEVLNVTNNLFGWQAMDASTVRDDQWQAMFDTYVTDTRDLGTREWFEQHNPTAQAQMLERMAEAMRKGYWDASEQTREELAERWQTLQDDFAVEAGSQVTRDFIAELAQGFGLDAGPADVASAAATEPATPTNTQAAEQPLEQIQGQMLEPVAPPPAQDNTLQLWVMVMMLLLIGSGALWQSLRNRRSRCEHLIIQ